MAEQQAVSGARSRPAPCAVAHVISRTARFEGQQMERVCQALDSVPGISQIVLIFLKHLPGDTGKMENQEAILPQSLHLLEGLISQVDGREKDVLGKMFCSSISFRSISSGGTRLFAVEGEKLGMEEDVKDKAPSLEKEEVGRGREPSGPLPGCGVLSSGLPSGICLAGAPLADQVASWLCLILMLTASLLVASGSPARSLSSLLGPFLPLLPPILPQLKLCALKVDQLTILSTTTATTKQIWRLDRLWSNSGRSACSLGDVGQSLPLAKPGFPHLCGAGAGALVHSCGAEEHPWAHVTVLCCCVAIRLNLHGYTASYIDFAHEPSAWVGLEGDNLDALLGDSQSRHPAGGLAHSGVWWLVRSELGQTAKIPPRVTSTWLLGFLTRWWLDSKDEPPRREKAGGEICHCFSSWRSQRVTSAAFCSSRKPQTSASFRGSRQTQLVDGGRHSPMGTGDWFYAVAIGWKLQAVTVNIHTAL